MTLTSKIIYSPHIARLKPNPPLNRGRIIDELRPTICAICLDKTKRYCKFCAGTGKVIWRNKKRFPFNREGFIQATVELLLEDSCDHVNWKSISENGRFCPDCNKWMVKRKARKVTST